MSRRWSVALLLLAIVGIVMTLREEQKKLPSSESGQEKQHAEEALERARRDEQVAHEESEKAGERLKTAQAELAGIVRFREEQREKEQQKQQRVEQARFDDWLRRKPLAFTREERLKEKAACQPDLRIPCAAMPHRVSPSPDGTMLAVLEDAGVMVYDAVSGENIARTVYASAPYGTQLARDRGWLSWHRSSRYVGVTGGDAACIVFDPRMPKRMARVDLWKDSTHIPYGIRWYKDVCAVSEGYGKYLLTDIGGVLALRQGREYERVLDARDYSTDLVLYEGDVHFREKHRHCWSCLGMARGLGTFALNRKVALWGEYPGKYYVLREREEWNDRDICIFAGSSPKKAGDREVFLRYSDDGRFLACVGTNGSFCLYEFGKGVVSTGRYCVGGYYEGEMLKKEGEVRDADLEVIGNSLILLIGGDDGNGPSLAVYRFPLK